MDATTMVWATSCQEMTMRGAWVAVKRLSHINYLELFTAFLTLKTFIRHKRRINVQLWMDNVTSIAFVNRMGGTHSTALLDLAVTIWELCLEIEIIIHAEYLPSSLNVRGEWESCHDSNSSN